MVPLTAKSEAGLHPLRVLVMADRPAETANLKALFVGAEPGQLTLVEPSGVEGPLEELSDVVLCDLGDIPRAGVDRVRLLRRSMPSTPIVVLTAVLDPGLEAELHSAGATEVLTRSLLPPGPSAAPTLVKLLEAAVARQVAENTIADCQQVERVLLAANPDGVLVLGEGSQILAFNQNACELLSRHPEDLRSGTFEIPGPIGVSNLLELRDDTGHERRLSVTAVPIDWHGEPGHLVTLREQRDVAAAEGSLLLDRLTGLPGREFFLADLGRQIKQASEDESTFAVLLVDLDRFKVVNDWLGRAAGDEMLEAAARRISASVRPTDLVARVGGDQFAVLLRRLRHTDDAILVGNRILQVLSRPFRLAGRELSTTASIGLVYNFGGDILDVDSLMAYAETGVTRAKGEGRNRVAVFDRALHDQRVKSLQRQAELRAAVENGDLRLVYQPVFDLTTHRICGLEALVRWEHRVQGWLAPSEFISVAEDSGLIVPLGEWVLAEACRQITEWREWDPELEVPPLSVNVSNRQLSHPQFLESFKRVTSDVMCDGAKLCIEITESAVLENPKRTAAIIHELRARGVEVHLDDFGTGFSSLAHLQSLPITALKVDRSFVARIPEHAQSTEIVRAIVALAHALDLRVIAEGVEEPEQNAELFKMGCDAAQGFSFARPMPAAEVFPMFQRSGTPALRSVPLGA
ncbi:MAG: GGDEF domain-containing response regulator [Acidimicrobiales bacterium]|nr:GGDEF domain-containing response regulator [Acidimicrobiales bacterium]